MSFRASIFIAAMVVASMSATASIARAQALAPRFNVVVIAELRDPRSTDIDEIHRHMWRQPKPGSPDLPLTAISPCHIWSRPHEERADEVIGHSSMIVVRILTTNVMRLWSGQYPAGGMRPSAKFARRCSSVSSADPRATR